MTMTAIDTTVTTAHTVVLTIEQKERLVALAKCASTDVNVFPMLAVVHFDGEGRAVAMDSYVLGLLDFDYDDKPISVPAKELVKALGPKSKQAVLRFHDENVEVAVLPINRYRRVEASEFEFVADLSERAETVARIVYGVGTFPRWQRLVPTSEVIATDRGKPWSDDDRSAYHDAGKVARVAAVGGPDCPVRVRWRGLKAGVVESSKGEMLGIVMPVRI